MQCVEVCPGDEPGIMVKCEIVVYLFKSMYMCVHRFYC